MFDNRDVGAALRACSWLLAVPAVTPPGAGQRPDDADVGQQLRPLEHGAGLAAPRGPGGSRHGT